MIIATWNSCGWKVEGIISILCYPNITCLCVQESGTPPDVYFRQCRINNYPVDINGRKFQAYYWHNTFYANARCSLLTYIDSPFEDIYADTYWPSTSPMPLLYIGSNKYDRLIANAHCSPNNNPKKIRDDFAEHLVETFNSSNWQMVGDFNCDPPGPDDTSTFAPNEDTHGARILDYMVAAKDGETFAAQAIWFKEPELNSDHSVVLFTSV